MMLPVRDKHTNTSWESVDTLHGVRWRLVDRVAQYIRLVLLTQARPLSRPELHQVASVRDANRLSNVEQYDR